MNRKYIFYIIIVFLSITTLVFLLLWLFSGEDEIVMLESITSLKQDNQSYKVLVKNNHFLPIKSKTESKTIDGIDFTLTIDKDIPGKKNGEGILTINGTLKEGVTTYDLF